MLAMGGDTGRTRVSDSDNLLGLTAALNLAGAGAVISTLWKIDRSDCIRFSKVFHGAIMSDLKGKQAEENAGR